MPSDGYGGATTGLGSVDNMRTCYAMLAHKFTKLLAICEMLLNCVNIRLTISFAVMGLVGLRLAMELLTAQSKGLRLEPLLDFRPP